MRDPARELGRVARGTILPSPVAPEVGPLVIELIDLAFLSLQGGEVHCATVDPRRRTGLEPRHLESRAVELLRKVGCGCLAGASAGDASADADVHPAAEKGSGREHDGPRAEQPSLDSLDARYLSSVQDEPGNGSLHGSERAVLLDE